MKMKLILGFLIVVVLVGVVALLPGYFQTEKPKELTTVKVGFSWVHEAQYAGLYWADQKGLYEVEGLKVEFLPYEHTDLVQDLVDGNFDFVFLQTDALLQARENGLPVKAIFADYRFMPTCYFSKKEYNILRPKDMESKTVGVAYSERYPLIAMLKKAGANLSKVNIVDREYIYEPLANGTYDVEAGWVTDGDIVKSAVGEYNVIHPFDYGVNWYADLITVTEDTINNNPEIVGRFLKATARGWQKAMENQDEAALLTLSYGGEDIEQLKPEHLRFVLRVSSPLIHTGDQHIGWMESKVFEDTQEMLLDQGVMNKPVNVEDIYTVEFLEKIHGEE